MKIICLGKRYKSTFWRWVYEEVKWEETCTLSYVLRLKWYYLIDFSFITHNSHLPLIILFISYLLLFSYSIWGTVGDIWFNFCTFKGLDILEFYKYISFKSPMSSHADNYNGPSFIFWNKNDLDFIKSKIIKSIAMGFVL